MSNINTLKPFKKGEKRTMEAGRKGGTISKRLPLDERLYALTQQKAKGSNKTIAEIINNTLVNKAMKGDLLAIKEFYNRTEGNSKQFITHNDNKDVISPIAEQLARIRGIYKESKEGEKRKYKQGEENES